MAGDEEEDELLAQFDKKAEEAKAETTVTERDVYEAFKVLDRRQLSLHIYPVDEPIPSPKYSYMLYALLAPSGRRLDLVFSFMLVTITGRNLMPIRDAIAQERCSMLQQFNSKKWPKPKDDTETLIESISYVMNNPASAKEEKERA